MEQWSELTTSGDDSSTSRNVSRRSFGERTKYAAASPTAAYAEKVRVTERVCKAEEERCGVQTQLALPRAEVASQARGAHSTRS
jgi:hypothetical protein